MEQWRAVVGYEGIYEVSDWGSVRRIAPWSDGRKTKPGKLTPNLSTNGYLRYTLRKNGAVKKHQAHRLVIAAFVGPLPSHHYVNHRNGVKTDNRVENLEYVTGSENQFHSYRVLKTKTRPGSKHHAAKISESDALAMRALRARGWTLKQLAAQFSLAPSTVCWICKNKAWKHV